MSPQFHARTRLSASTIQRTAANIIANALGNGKVSVSLDTPDRNTPTFDDRQADVSLKAGREV